MGKLKLLSFILKTSGMGKVLSSFLIFFLASAIIIWLVDANVASLFDAIWFCFAAVTTIGFGDIVITNFAARVVTIVLSLYGILVIAIITGVIVYYISEILRIKGTKSIAELQHELHNLDKLSKENLKELSARIRSIHDD